MLCPGVPSLTKGTNEDVKDPCGDLVEKADIDWETDISFISSVSTRSQPAFSLWKGEDSYYTFLMERLFFFAVG